MSLLSIKSSNFFKLLCCLSNLHQTMYKADRLCWQKSCQKNFDTYYRSVAKILATWHSEDTSQVASNSTHRGHTHTQKKLVFKQHYSDKQKWPPATNTTSAAYNVKFEWPIFTKFSRNFEGV